VGFFFALPLFMMIFSRLALEEPLPAGLQPSMLILSAPFSIGFSAYVTTSGGRIDAGHDCVHCVLPGTDGKSDSARSVGDAQQLSLSECASLFRP